MICSWRSCHKYMESVTIINMCFSHWPTCQCHKNMVVTIYIATVSHTWICMFVNMYKHWFQSKCNKHDDHTVSCTSVLVLQCVPNCVHGWGICFKGSLYNENQQQHQQPPIIREHACNRLARWFPKVIPKRCTSWRTHNLYALCRKHLNQMILLRINHAL